MNKSTRLVGSALVCWLAGACTEPPAPFESGSPLPEAEPSVSAIDPVTSTLPLRMPAIAVWLAPGISADQQDAVRAGVDGWAKATSAIREWHYTQDRGSAQLAIHQVGPYARLCDGQPETNALGCVRAHGGLWDNQSGQAMDLYLIDGNYEVAATLTVMHEIGHLFGLSHDDGGIMTAPAPKAMLEASWECPDAETVDALQARLGIEGLISCEAPIVF